MRLAQMIKGEPSMQQSRKRYIIPVGLLVAGLCLSAGVMIAGMTFSEPEKEYEAVIDEAAPEGATLFEERIQAIAMSCAACHGTDGRLQTAIPLLAAQPAAVMRAQLLAFKQDQMPDATVMPRLAKGYTDEELEALADYFSSLSRRANPGSAL